MLSTPTTSASPAPSAWPWPWQRRLLLVLLLICCSSLITPSVLAYEEPLSDDPLQDDATAAVERVRERLATADNETLGGKYGVVLVVSAKDMSYASLTIPIWREYCKKHKMGFYLHQEPLNNEMSFMWSRPRLLMEILPVTKWRYMMVVEANTLPKDFNKSWEYMIKLHMRHKRHKNDDPSKRLVFCPWDCDEEYSNPYEDGACSGPVTSACIFWSQKEKTQRLIKSWYLKRHEPDLPSGDDAVAKAMHKMKEANWEQVYYRDIADEVGRPHSKFIPAYAWSPEYKWNIRDRIYDVIRKDKTLAEVANKASKSKPKGEL